MGKTASLIVLTLAEVAGMSLWFTASAVIAPLSEGAGLDPWSQAALASAVQAGFVAGALGIALSGIADRFDARYVFALSAVMAAFASAVLLILPAGLWSDRDVALALSSRLFVGAALAGVYPVGMRLATAWGVKDRGFLVGIIVGALTLGSALPHLVALSGGDDWRFTIILTSGLAVFGGLAVLGTGTGPHLVRAGAFRASALVAVWHSPPIRAAYLGYFGHMWELYAMWAWLGSILAAGFAGHMPDSDISNAAGLTVFAAISAGGAACLIGGHFADRFGKAEVAVAAMLASGLMACAVAAALWLQAPPWMLITLAVLWGAAVIPDSPQFSALVADHAPAGLAGSLMTLQTALGFALTTVTVQGAPLVAAALGWPLTVLTLALGPLFGLCAMFNLRLHLRP